MADNLVLAADHQAVAALESRNTAARAHIQIVKIALFQLDCAPNIVAVIRVAAVDDDIFTLQKRDQLCQSPVHHRCRYH
jgi:hypothetical protein